MSTMHQNQTIEFVIVALKGGDSSSARAAVCLDLERGNVTNGEEWAALVRGDRLEEFLDQTAATLVHGPALWDGQPFGDGVCGTVERAEDGSVHGAGLYRPGLAAPSFTAKDEQCVT